MTTSDLASRLNRDCHCVAVDREQLEGFLGDGLGAPAAKALLEAHRSLFASSPVFLAQAHIDAMRRAATAIAEVVATPGYVAHVAERSPPPCLVSRALASTESRAARDGGPTQTADVLLSYDFHLGTDGPRLIEINTNPGGVLLGLQAARAQRECCAEVAESLALRGARIRDAEALLVRSFEDAWRHLAGQTGADPALRALAIVDASPREQFLYPEMVLCRHLLERHGIETAIADIAELELAADGRLTAGGVAVDAVYNRHTDFYLEQPPSAALRRACVEGRAAVTPNPRAYALFADKRNLPLLRDTEKLTAWGLGADTQALLRQAVPATSEVEAKDAEALWGGRRGLFFKPIAGYGSKGAYDGQKITRKVFDAVLAGGYVAQERIAPSERVLRIAGEDLRLKVDLRYVTYAGELVAVLARLYRGQTTNLRTEGGGLATVFALP